MVDQEMVKAIAKRIFKIKAIKLEDSKVYNEYSVIIFYMNDDSDILICDTSEEANGIYNYLKEKINEYNGVKKPEGEKSF